MPYQFSTTAVKVTNNDVIRFQYKALDAFNATETVNIRLGDLDIFWRVFTLTEDRDPDPYSLNAYNAALNEVYTFDPITFQSSGGTSNVITGLSPGLSVSLVLTKNFLSASTDDYAVRINGGAWINSNIPNVQNGDRIDFRVKAASTSSTERRVGVQIGNTIKVFSITTPGLPPNVPNPFPDFTDLINQPLSTDIYSNILRVTGLNAAAAVNVDQNAYFAISNTNTATTNANGFSVLSGVSFTQTGNIDNGQYLQLRYTTSNSPQTPATITLGIGTASNGSDWSVTTGNAANLNPGNITFPAKTGVATNTLIASDTRPSGGITSLSPGVSVPVTLEPAPSTTSSEVKIKINNGSIGLFPATVTNGDTITLYARSSNSINTTVNVVIKVGNTIIQPWQITTGAGPDTLPTFTPPANATNQPTNTYVTSSSVAVTDINVPITITATNGAVISIDNDSTTSATRTFDPYVNTGFSILLLSSSSYGSAAIPTSVTVGTASAFTWSVQTAGSAPTPSTYLSSWYSKKNERRSGLTVKKAKDDGYSIGTVLQVLKEKSSVGVYDGYGDFSYSNLATTTRYPGYLVCDGTSYSASEFPLLFEVIGNTYGGNAVYNTVSKGYSGTFKVPDYRNVRMCGNGVVDGNKASSVSLSPTLGSSGSTGAIGGSWYFDTVDVTRGVSANDPLEQVEATSATLSAGTGTISSFFELGTVKTTGATTVTGDVTFTTAGSISAIIGPTSERFTSAPIHDHTFISAVVEGNNGDPLIPWGVRSLFYLPQSWQVQNSGKPNDQGPILALKYIKDALQSASQNFFQNEIALTGRNVDALLAPLVPAAAGGITTSTILTFENWYPTVAIFTAPLNPNPAPPPGNTSDQAMIDTSPTNFSIESYAPTNLLTHSHYITTIRPARFDYSYGAADGVGTKVGFSATDAPAATDAAATKTITFNAAGTTLGVNDATFTMSSTIKNPIPEVSLKPKKVVPIGVPFHKVRYIIKAY